MPTSETTADSLAALPEVKQRSTVRTVLMVMGVVVLIACIVWFLLWFTSWRFFQSTNDAYLQADQVIVAPKIQGYVAEVFVAENQEVKVGQDLVHIDSRQYEAMHNQSQATVDSRKADIARADAALSEQRAMSEQAEAQLANARSDAKFAEMEVQRFEPLAKSGADTEEHLAKLRNDHSQALGALRAATAAVLASQKSIATGEAQLAQTRAQLEVSQETARESQLDLGDTVLRSAIDGRIADKTVRVGQYVQPGTRLMSVVPTQDIYLEANFKETQIKLMRVGQPVKIRVDAWPDSDIRGTVESFSPGTGSQFALLPPENATGNFTKIVQRVPVRIHIDAEEKVRKLLVPGLSVAVEVDTRSARDEADREGKDIPAGKPVAGQAG